MGDLIDAKGYKDGEEVKLKARIKIVNTFHGLDTYLEIEMPKGESKSFLLW